MVKEERHSENKLVFYELMGEGDETIVLCSGLSRSSRHWLGFPKYLMSHGFRVLVADNRGFGRSKHLPLKHNHKVLDFAEDLHRVIRHEGLESFHLMGLSLGGMIAAELCALESSKVQSLTLVNSSAKQTYPLRLSPGGASSLVKIGLQKDDEARCAKQVEVLLNCDASDEHFEEFQKQLLEIEQIEPINVVNVLKQINAARRFNLNKIARNISCPTLILYSDQDRFVPSQNSFGLQQILPHAVLKCISGHGHELMMSSPEQVSNAFHEFVGTKP